MTAYSGAIGKACTGWLRQSSLYVFMVSTYGMTHVMGIS